MNTIHYFDQKSPVEAAWLLADFMNDTFYWNFVVGGAPISTPYGEWNLAFASTDVTELSDFKPLSPQFSHQLTNEEDFFLSVGGEVIEVHQLKAKIFREKSGVDSQIRIAAIGKCLNITNAKRTDFYVDSYIEFRGIWCYEVTKERENDLLNQHFPGCEFELTVDLDSKRFYNLVGATDHLNMRGKNGKPEAY